MRLITQQKNKKILFCCIMLAAAAIAVGAYVLSNRTATRTIVNVADRPANSVNYGPPTEAEKQTLEQQKETILKQNETTPSSETADITVSIIRADQISPGQDLNIRAEVTGAKTGTCEVQLAKDGQPAVIKSFPVVFEATSSRCQGADIARSEFSKGGEWKLSLSVHSGDKQSKAVEEIIHIDG